MKKTASTETIGCIISQRSGVNGGSAAELKAWAESDSVQDHTQQEEVLSVRASHFRNSPILIAVYVLIALFPQTISAEEIAAVSPNPAADSTGLTLPVRDDQSHLPRFRFPSGRLGTFRVSTPELDTLRPALASTAFSWQAPDAPKPGSGQTTAAKRKGNVPVIIAGLALIGIGAAVMATNAEEHQGRLARGGNIPCQTIGGSEYWSGMCHYTMEHSGAFKGGVALVVIGSLTAILGAVIGH